MSGSDSPGNEGLKVRRLAVANIREDEAADYVELVFLESARFYHLPRDSEHFAESLSLLEQALSENRSLTVVLAAPNSNVIVKVET